MGINFGGVIYAWNSAPIIALFCVAGVLFIGFAIQQAFCMFTTERTRLFPVEMMYSRSRCILFAQTSAGSSSVYV
jgi:hypothetical protein